MIYGDGLLHLVHQTRPYEKVTGGDAYPWSRFTSPVPVYDVNGWIIWGLTGRVTMVLVEEIAKRRSEV